MSEVILYISVSLDGFIAPPNGSVDWLDENRFQDGVGEDEVNTGIQASYTMGSISISAAINSVESAGGTANKDAEASIFVASFAF